MEKHGTHVRDEDESDADWPSWEGFPDQSVSEDGPVTSHEADFNPAGPPGRTQVCGTW